MKDSQKLTYKSLLIAFASSTILLFLIIPLGGYPFGHHIKFSIALFSYFAITFLFIRKIPAIKQQLLLAVTIFLPVFLVYGVFFIYLMGFAFYSVAVPSNIAHFLGIIFAVIIVNLRKVYKIASTLIIILGSLWVTFFGYNYWMNKLNNGSFSGLVSEHLLKDYSFYNKDGSRLRSDDINNKIVVLDFWSTSCGICFRKFPLLNEKYNKYKVNSSIKIFAVNIPVKRDSANTPFKILEEAKYDFPVIVDRDSFAIKFLKIQAVPQVIIFRNDTIFFRGDISLIDKCLVMLATKR
jgi:thiol-disulfide isomerase/thioredoxin